MNENEFFYKLSPDLVIQALENSGLHPSGQCQPLYALENRVYELVLENSENVVAKFYRPERWSKEQIQDEHDFLFMMQDVEIPVCAPLRFDDGSSIKFIENIPYGVWPLTGGREPIEFSDDELMILGRALARIHNCGSVLAKKSRRPAFSEDVMLFEPLRHIKNSINPQLYIEYEKIVHSVAHYFNERNEGVEQLLIHGDCHLGNLLQGSGVGGWFFLDFDDCRIGPAVQDLWMLVRATGEDASYQMTQILEGYRQFRPFKESWLELVEVLRAIRFIFYAGWIAKRWQDPAFTAAFPHFGSEEYWVREINDLKKQLVLIEGCNSLEHNSNAEASNELTNKDFFFDWED